MMKSICVIALGCMFSLQLKAQDAGTLDLTFGDGNTQGWVELDVSAVSGKVSLEIMDDGRIVVTGRTNSHILIIRLLPNGQLDPSFDGDGILEIVFGETQFCGDILKAENNSLLIGHGSYDDSYYLQHYAILKIQEDGSIDYDYGFDGIATSYVGISNVLNCLVPMGESSVLFCGYGYGNDGMEWYVGAKNNEGMDDSIFSAPASQFYSPTLNVASEMTVLSSGEVVVIGSSGADALLVKLGPDGSFVDEFGDNGSFTLGIAGGDGGSDIDRNAADDILCSAIIYEGNYYGSRIFSFDSEGNPNEEFGVLGLVDFPQGLDNVIMNDIRIQPDGSIVFSGYYENILSGLVTPYLGRLLPDGTLDPEFHSDGYAVIPSDLEGMTYQDIQFQFNDKIVTAGRKGEKIVVARYHSGGMLDVSEPESERGELSLFPNPVSGCVNLRFDSNGELIRYVQLMDETGRVMATHPVNGAGMLTYDCSPLENGVYLLRICGDSYKSNVTKLVVCH